MREAGGQRGRKPAFPHLTLRLGDGIVDAAEGGGLPLAIEQQPGRAGVAVSGLADGAGIEEPAALQLDLGSARRETAEYLPAVERDRKGDMAVTHEHERGIGELQRRARGLLRQDVLPNRISRAGVEEVDPLGLSGGPEALEKGARVLRQHLRRPEGRGGRFVVEVADRELTEDDEVVVADEAAIGSALHRVAALVGQGAVPNRVPEAPDGVHVLGIDLREHRLEGVIVSVDVR